MLGILDRFRVDWPDEKEAILRGLERQYARGTITEEEHESLIEDVHAEEPFAHMVSEPFDLDDDRTECVACGENAMLEVMGYSGRPCPACGAPTTARELRERGIL